VRECLKNSLFACGIGGLPKTAFIAGRQWMRVRTFKHDFFAATGLYEATDSITDSVNAPRRIVLKINRIQSFLGFPLGWIGRYLKQREYRLLQRLQSLDQIPQLLGEYGRNGFAYRYIEGRSLDEKPDLPDSFFDALKHLLEQIHRRGVCYLDFNKRGNILIGNDGRPYLIDFQISLMLQRRGFQWLCRRLQQEDHYHLLKHKRRLRPDLMTDSEKALSRRQSTAIRVHRFLTVPLRTLRRRLLGVLHRKGLLKRDDSSDPTPENDPTRFMS